MFEEGIELKKRYGADNVFDLSLGNPVVEPPPEFQKELRRVVENPLPGMHRYMENAGYADTRAAVAEHITRENGINFTQNDIVMTCGAAGALNVVLKTLLNPGEEVVVFAPYFVEYLHYIENHGGKGKVLPTDDNFMPRLDVLEASIDSNTKAVIIDSPNNPTGVVYDGELLKKMGEVIRRKENEYGRQIYLISDEPYSKIIYDGLKYPSPFHCHQRSIVVTSYSKDLALPGERIGYIAAHPDCSQQDNLMDGFILCNRILGYVNAPAFMQHVVRKLQTVSVSIEDYQKKRDFMYSNLTEMGYTMVKPQGAFYFFPKSPLEDEVAFVRELQEFHVLTVPGRGFGVPGHFRMSYCVDDRTLEGSLDGFKKVAEKFGLS